MNTSAADGSGLGAFEAAVRTARQRVWATDMTCYYAHRRYVQSGSESDRVVWLVRSADSGTAVATLQRAERALAEAREYAGSPGGPE